MASEMEVQTTASASASSADFMRFSRRTSVAPNSSPSTGTMSMMTMGFSFPTIPTNMASNANPTNYSTMNLTALTSGAGSAVLSSSTTTTPPAAANLTHIDSHPLHYRRHPPHHQRSQTQTQQAPAVCGFSGLPLFPPETNNHPDRPANPNIIPPENPSMEDTSTTTSPTAWIDGIIKDLIHSSTDVSIPQLIHNVREIIYPCNPNLAALLEYRLRSITETPTPLPNWPITVSSERKTKEALSVQHQGQGQGHGQLQMQGSTGLKLNLDSSLHNVAIFSPPDSSSASASYLHWGLTVPALAHEQLHHHHPNAHPPLSLDQVHRPPPLPQHQSHEQQHQQELENSSPAAEEATTTTIVTTSTAVTPPSPPAAAIIREKKEEMRQQKRDEEGLHLLTLLLQCAEAVSADNFEEANKMLLEIAELSTPFGTSAQRVAAYFSEAMSARLVSSCLGIYAALSPSSLPNTHIHKMASAFQVFNGISPFVKFSHFTANQAIQEAFEREERVHIIDLDIMQGLQWPGLFHILASRPGGPPYVRLTGLGTSVEALEATGKRLSDFADKLGLPFEFFPVADKVGNVDPERLNVSKREAVAVHWLQHSLYDVTGSDNNTLWLLQR